MTKFLMMGRDANGNLIPISLDAAGRLVVAACAGASDFATIRVGDIAGGDYFQVEADGIFVLNGEATTWDDFSVPASLARQGLSTKPDFDFTNLGLLFPQNDATEIAYIIAQMPHKKLLDSQIYWHVHYIQSVAAQPTFYIDYRFYLNGAAVPGSWTTIDTSANKGVFTYPGSGNIMQIGVFPTVSPPANETISANIDVRLYRDDNDVAGDVLVKYIDFHYQIDTSGSREQFTK